MNLFKSLTISLIAILPQIAFAEEVTRVQTPIILDFDTALQRTYANSPLMENAEIEIEMYAPGFVAFGGNGGGGHASTPPSARPR